MIYFLLLLLLNRACVSSFPIMFLISVPLLDKNKTQIPAGLPLISPRCYWHSPNEYRTKEVSKKRHLFHQDIRSPFDVRFIAETVTRCPAFKHDSPFIEESWPFCSRRPTRVGPVARNTLPFEWLFHRIPATPGCIALCIRRQALERNLLCPPIWLLDRKWNIGL